jgi:integrase
MVEDVDTHNWTFFVRHPKGENRYAKKRTVRILQPAREPTLRFLMARKDYLLKRRFPTDGPLVPSIHEGRVKAYSSNAFRVMKAEVQKIAVIEFSLKDFRPTFTQMMLDLDPPSSPMSRKSWDTRLRGRRNCTMAESATATPSEDSKRHGPRMLA